MRLPDKTRVRQTVYNLYLDIHKRLVFCKTRRLKIIPVDSIIGEIPSIDSPS